MKTVLRPVLGLVPMFLLAGCAGTHEIARSTAPAVVPAPAAPISEDDRYMALVEEIAKRRGVEVVWVNKPNKHDR